MYYYIFEAPVGQKGFERTGQIKEQLSALGIAGEMAMLSGGKTVEDLVSMAVAKRYSTIVAVGGIDLINQVARAIEEYDVVFGIIPNTDNADLASLIGTSGWKEATEFLKKRLWRPVRLGIINEKNCFLTPATIEIEEDSSYQFLASKYQVRGTGYTQARITPIGVEGKDNSMLKVEFIKDGTSKKRSVLSRFFAKETQIVGDSCFVVNSFELNTSKAAKVIVAGAEIESTPLKCRTQEKMIRLIVGKTV